YKSISIAEINNFFVLQKVYGPGFYIGASYSYLLIFAGALLVLINNIRISSIFRIQNFIIVLAIVAMITPNLLYITGNNPIEPYDPTPLSFTLASILFLYAFFNFRFLNIVPIAYSLVFKNLKNGVLILDNKTRIVGMNSAAELILNCTLNKALGMPAINLFPGSKEIIKQYLSKEEAKTEIMIGVDESIYELQISALRDNSNRIIGQIFFLYNISEQKRAYEELDAFARTVAHDLKSPLSSVIGFSDILSENTFDEEDQSSYLNYISISAKKMIGIVDSLLLLARTRHIEKLPKTTLNTEQIVDSAINRLSNLMAENNAEIIKPDSWIDVDSYPEWIEEVWVNYISNAIKYGGESPVITLSSKRIGNMVKMSVKDNGDGISVEDQALLFTEFTRLYNHKGAISGHGLGLSIVKRIINKLGGQFGIESKPGFGSTFFFTLPVASYHKKKKEQA
ncbi:MAG: PAS domain-containing protein, partial [Bacteroidetes bacterium]|nr:PAS domain-containing protein [Bacteroidota bacterium]